ncbi:TPR end-of-group domain-containing protein [Pedobacter panaciterrae]|uniref:Transglutaminase-like domain-containing protein n=1 Tax=Pedobacter panaciterrae TaxID=363849 RepID=A0ABU8NJY8_9SPHI
MKKALLTILLIVPIINSIAQKKPSVTTKSFKTYTSALDNNRRIAADNKNYIEAVSLINEWLVKYEEAAVDTQATVKNWYPGMYYNLACYQNLLGSTTQALAAFDKCVKLGYSNYYNTIQDTDLKSLHGNKRFEKALLSIRERGDMNYILKTSPPYLNGKVTALPPFIYQSPDSKELVDLKVKFNLDSVAGNGNEISKIKRLLFWAYNIVPHQNGDNPPSRNANDIIEVCKRDKRGVNCRMKATILKDALHAEGFKSRMITCMPKDTADTDCHVINVVWSKTLNKWLWMDPTFNAYVSDNKGELLSVEEVRTHLINNSELLLNKDAFRNKEFYLDFYMSKNLYWLRCPVNSVWDVETYSKNNTVVQYVNLYPGRFNTVNSSRKTSSDTKVFEITNPNYFWQKPLDN